MSCFCRNSLGPLQLALPGLSLSATLSVPGAHIALSLSDWLGARGLPAAPWAPELAWLQLPLPSLRLNANAMATISAFAQLRATVLAQFGLDLMVSAQAQAFARLAATASARLSAMLNLNINPMPWQQLAALNFAIGQLQAALSMGLFANLSAYVALPNFAAFLAALMALLPLIAVSLQMNLALNASLSAQLSAAIRAMLAINMPSIPTANLSLMAQLTASLSAIASLQASLGISPLQVGFPGVQAMLSARLAVLLPQISAALGMSVSLPNLLALLPALPYCPTMAVTAPVVQMAASINAQAVASMNWQVPALSAVALLNVGLPVCALTAQLNAALGINAVLNAPCPICDAAAVLAAAMSL
jgi:hypothetical protein